MSTPSAEVGRHWWRSAVPALDGLISLLLLVRLPLLAGLLLWSSRGLTMSEAVERVSPGGPALPWHALGKLLLDAVVATHITVPAVGLMVASMAGAVALERATRRWPAHRHAFALLQIACVAALVACAWSRFFLDPISTATLTLDLAILIFLNSNLVWPAHLEAVSPRTSRWFFVVLPGLAELFFPVLYFRAVLDGFGLGAEPLRRVTSGLQTAWLLAMPVGLWLLLCFRFGEPHLQFEALHAYGRNPLPDGCERVLSEYGYSSVDQMALDPFQPRAFVACSLLHEIAVLDLTGRQPPRRIPVGVRLYSVAYDNRHEAILYYDNMRDQLVRMRLDEERPRARQVCGGVFSNQVIPVNDPSRVVRDRFITSTPPEHVIVRVDEARRRALLITNNVAPFGERARLVEVALDSMHRVRAFDDIGLAACRDILIDWERRRLYLSYDFHRGVSVLDLEDMHPIGVLDVNSHNGQMALSQRTGEIVVADASAPRLVTFDATTLQPRRSIAAPRGIRSVAVDDTRGVVLADSVLSGRLYRFDLASGQLLASMGGFYPKFRYLEVEPGGGRALVSTWNFVYQVRY